MDDCARDMRQQLQAIADSGFPLPTSTLLRKAVVSVKKGKFMFSPEQLSRVVQMIMEKKPYLLSGHGMEWNGRRFFHIP